MIVPSAFDNYATTYDSEFTHSNIGRMQRERVWHFLNKTLPINKMPFNVLEINCGTGFDAHKLSSFEGFKVTATDASSRMIETATELYGNSQQLKFQVQSFSELNIAFHANQFDFIFSNFGGLNCIDETTLTETLNTLSKLLKPNGKMVLVIMGTACIWENLYFTLMGQFSKAFRRRQKNGLEAAVFGETIKTYYYSPAKIKTIFKKDLALQSVKPIGLFIPPSYLENYFEKHLTILSYLNKLDYFFDFSFLSNMADHYYIEFRKEGLT